METIVKPPVTFTESAIEEIKRLITEPDFDQNKLLRVAVKGGGCSGLTYVLDFDIAKPTDSVFEYDAFKYLMDKAHEIYLSGMQIDWQGGLNARGFMFNNPNASSTCGCGTSFAV